MRERFNGFMYKKGSMTDLLVKAKAKARVNQNSAMLHVTGLVDLTVVFGYGASLHYNPIAVARQKTSAINAVFTSLFTKTLLVLTPSRLSHHEQQTLVICSPTSVKKQTAGVQ
ncbi:Receptor expression-enhancing protein 5 [Microtus ochrogaster]|uniref:Receptor expression-enhancing protein 5 n=1 Tax=Microtus ochrogaster TaxID=79684 RepID=A0A8J6G5Q6_MICOH|nr:Receptor expression-enhancing protein 5 [Microtus ochrogaster]